jgi:RNA polymerase sigma factor (sigma-70 family)
MSKSQDDFTGRAYNERRRKLVEAATNYQQVYERWKLATGGAREQLEFELKDTIAALLLLLRPVMYKQARRWLAQSALTGRSSAFNNSLDTLALDFFFALIERLHTVRIDPDKHVEAYLGRVARNGFYDRFKKDHPPQETQALRLDQPLSETGEQLLRDTVADPDTVDQDELIVWSLSAKECLAFMRKELPTILNKEDQTIVLARLSEPPLSYELIAQQIGPGYSEEALRKRYERALHKIRQYLKRHGWDLFD